MLKILEIKKAFILILILSVSLVSYSQTTAINFAWENKTNDEGTGILAYGWSKNQQLGIWELELNVSWYNNRGESVSSNQPFIYLSEYDLEIKSEENILCQNFSASSNLYEISFQSSYSLRFNIPAEIESPGSIELNFKYALSEQDISKANINPLKLSGTDKVLIAFPDTRVPAQEPEVDQSNTDISKLTLPDPEELENCSLIRQKIKSVDGLYRSFSRDLGELDSKIVSARSGIDNFDQSDTIRRNEFEKELQEYLVSFTTRIGEIDTTLAELDRIGNIISAVNLPGDSSSAYLSDLQELEGQVKSVREEYVQNRIQVRGLRGRLNSTYTDPFLGAMKENLIKKYKSTFESQIDSIAKVQEDYYELEPDLLTEIKKGPRKAYRNENLKIHTETHNSLRSCLDSLDRQHIENYFEYRASIEETGEIIPLETLHVRFDEILGSTRTRMNNLDLQISALESSLNERIVRPAPKGVVIGGSILLFILIVIFLIRYSRGGKAKSPSASKSLIVSSGDEGFDLLDSEEHDKLEYYKILVPQDQEDVVLTEIHFHLRSIKSVYHLIQKALLEKNPDYFGGLFFGRQYKAKENGNEKFVLIVDRVVPANTIRQDMASENEKGELLVEEIEKLVSENKKLALLGWFTSGSDNDLEMSENMVKVHRTYFREKWQIAGLLYPGIEEINTRFFVRRKSGFFDTTPSEGYRISWDKLYQFAINPPSKKELEKKTRPEISEYIKIELNKNWSDSIVEYLYILPDVLNEISAEVENRIQLVAGQIANSYLYGEVWDLMVEGEENKKSYEVFINKISPANGRENPREIPGYQLIGWVRFDEEEIFEMLKSAIPFHNELFKQAFQIAVLLNTQSDELRFFSRKNSMEMNNNTIETEEFNLSALIHSAGSKNIVS